jgi:hypothetical protein
MPTETDIRAAKVTVNRRTLTVNLQDGRSLRVPLKWFPDLKNATSEQLADHRLIGDGVGIHWESLGVDLSVQGLLFDSPPISESPEKPKRVTYHVVPTDGEWRVKRQGETRYTSFRTKDLVGADRSSIIESSCSTPLTSSFLAQVS